MFSAFVLMVPMIYLSGLIFPIENMPVLFQRASLLIPVRYYAVILRGIFLKGSGLDVLWPQALALLAIGSVGDRPGRAALPQAAGLRDGLRTGGQRRVLTATFWAPVRDAREAYGRTARSGSQARRGAPRPRGPGRAEHSRSRPRPAAAPEEAARRGWSGSGVTISGRVAVVTAANVRMSAVIILNLLPGRLARSRLPPS